MSKLRWGLSLSLAGDLAQPELIAEVGASAEAEGWDGLFVWDHLWNRTGEPFADPWITSAAVAIATERISIGPLVTPLPRRRPQVVAQQAATLDRLSGGRLILGVGLGHDNYGELSAFDEPFLEDRERAARLDANLDLLLAALTGEPVPYADDRRTTVTPVQRPRCPVWVAGTVGRAAGPRRAERHVLEGIALVGTDEWTPQHVAEALAAGSFEPGEIDVALVGGAHPEPDALAEAGATWAVPEMSPGTTEQEVRDRASRPPP